MRLFVQIEALMDSNVQIDRKINLKKPWSQNTGRIQSLTVKYGALTGPY